MGKCSEVFDSIKVLAVYVPGADGRNTHCIGCLLSRGRDGFEAFDRNTRSLGVYADQRSAVSAAWRVGAAPIPEC
jgi:hypothetical protein